MIIDVKYIFVHVRNSTKVFCFRFLNFTDFLLLLFFRIDKKEIHINQFPNIVTTMTMATICRASAKNLRHGYDQFLRQIERSEKLIGDPTHDQISNMRRRSGG